ncbi:unnamed protein product [Trichobilharzia szidati]|nr:unnamed protein product [Trichobilharzia szidati]
MGRSREKQSTSGVNKQPTTNNLSSSGSLCTSSVSLLSSASNPPGQCVGEQKSWSVSSQMNEQCEKSKKCINSVKKIDRRMAKQMTERKRRDRINALLNNLRTLILKLLHKNPRHHRKLEKADILELVVSFLKKELNQTRGKMSSVNPPTTSISQQTNTPPAILLKETKYPAQIESCTPLIYPQSSSLNHSELFPLLNQPNNYHFVKNNNTNNHNHNVASKISYPFNDSSIQQYPHLYTSMYPYPYNLPCCRGEPCQSLAVSHYSTPLTYQPVMLISPTEDFDDINKENRVTMNKNHNYFKNTNYTPSCYSSNDTLDRCSIVRQPMNTLNNNNNNNNNDYYYQANNQAYSSQVQLKQQSPESMMMTMTKLYPDILNNHLPEEQQITIQGENCYKCCYMSSTLNDDGQSSQNFIRNTENHNYNCNCNNPVVTLNHRRMHSSASTSSSTSSSGESTNHSTTLWRPYV